MIDWLTIYIPYHGPNLGEQEVLHDTRTGEMRLGRFRAVHARASNSATMMVQVVANEMLLSGNPVKFLSGQNVFGTSDIWKLSKCIYECMIKFLELPDCVVAQNALRHGNVKITRVDCTYHYHVGTDEDVNTWLRAMSECTNVRYRGRGHFDPLMASLIYGLRIKEGQKPKGSAYSSFKFYNKHFELKKNPPNVPEDILDRCFNYSYGMVRGEALFRAKELKKTGHDLLKNWDRFTCYSLHKRWVDRMDITGNVELLTNVEDELPRSLRSTYRLWRNGEDLLELMHRATFYRHRKALLEYGIDISASRVRNDDDVRVFPVVEVLQARPVNPEQEEQIFWEIVKVSRM